MTPHDLTGSVPGLLVTKDRCSVVWMTVQRDWPPAGKKWLIGDMPNMLVAMIVFYNKAGCVSGEVGRFSLN